MNTPSHFHPSTPRYLLALGLLGLAACELPDQADDQADAELLRSEGEPPPGDYQLACPLERQIAVKSEARATCPDAINWMRTDLFPDSENAEGDETLLSNYCLYVWNGANPITTTDVIALAGVAGLDELHSDCEVVFSQSNDPISLAAAPLLRTMFLERLHQPPGSALTLDPAPVEVAVIDTVPEGASTPNSWHGEFMAWIIEDVACPANSNCNVDVQRWLGLPRVEQGVKDLVNGGFYGSQGDLAKAIYAAVEAWKSAGNTDKLIISLSVGWDGDIYDAAGESAPVDAIQHALEYAWCQGALVLVAAGNEGPACTTGPLLPGGFETLAVPDGQRCAALGTSMVPPGPQYRPLVYSVGGLRLNDQPMPGSREDGLPRLAALATHVVAGKDDLTTTLTGTSVAAATVAGAAALLWSQQPNLSASQVMAKLYATGDPVGFPADYVGPGTSATATRKINMCAALGLTACADTPPSVTKADVVAAITSLQTTPTQSWTHAHDDGCDSVCGGTFLGYSDSIDVCPQLIASDLPFTHPQPGQPACPNCTLKKDDGEVYAALDPAFDGMTITTVGIEVVGVDPVSGWTSVHFDLTGATLTSTEVARLDLDEARFPPNVRSATISIQFDHPDLPRPLSNEMIVN